MDEDTFRAQTSRSWSETQLEKLYLALNKDYPDGQIREIVADLKRLGMAVPYLVAKVQFECGAIGAGRLRRLAEFGC